MKDNNKLLVKFLIAMIFFPGCVEPLVDVGGSGADTDFNTDTNTETISYTDSEGSSAEGSDSESSDINGSDSESPDVHGSDSESPDPDDECFQPLPTDMSGLKELYHWKASGPTAAYTHMMVSPVVGNIVTENPSIVAVAYPSPSGEHFNGAHSRVYAIDGPTGTQQWVAEVSAMQATPAIGDVDSSGSNEVIVLGYNAGYKLFALEGETGDVLWESTSFTPPAAGGGANITFQWHAYGIVLTDIENNGSVEAIYAGHVFDGKTGVLLYKLSDTPPITDTTVMDVNDAPGKEIITNTGIFNSATQKKICTFSIPITGFAVGKLTSDEDIPKIIGTDSLPGIPSTKVIAYSADDCSIHFSVPFTGGGKGGLVTIANYDTNVADMEIGIPGVQEYTVLGHDGSVLLRADTYGAHDHTATGSTTFDFNGDGQNEIVYNSTTALMVLNGVTGEKIYAATNSNFTIAECPIVVDVNGDGHANIVVASSVYPGVGSDVGIRVFQDPENKWAGARNIWNQAHFHITNVADDGKLTGFNSSEIWQDYVTKEYRLGFRNNLTIIDKVDTCGPVI